MSSKKTRKTPKARTEPKAPAVLQNWDPTREWYGSAMYPDGFHHADMRAVDNSVQMTLLPAEAEHGMEIWQLRLRGGGDELEKLATAFETGERYIWPQGEDGGIVTGLVYFPRWDHDDEGVFGRVRIDPDVDYAETGMDFTRRFDFPTPVFEEMGRNLRRLIPALDPSANEDEWEAEVHAWCDACARPIFDSMPTALVMGTPARPVVMACPLCVNGKTLEVLNESGVKIDPQMRTMLEAVSSVLV